MKREREKKKYFYMSILFYDLLYNNIVFYNCMRLIIYVTQITLVKDLAFTFYHINLILFA